MFGAKRTVEPSENSFDVKRDRSYKRTLRVYTNFLYKLIPHSTFGKVVKNRENPYFDTFGFGFGLRPKAEVFAPPASAFGQKFTFGRPLMDIHRNRGVRTDRHTNR